MRESIHKRELFIVGIGIFILEFLCSILIIYLINIGQIRNQLNEKIARVHEDVRYTNTHWDITAYNTDPVLVGKSPLYLITTAGFVIDRRSPIHGFLDTSDFKRLLSYQKIQTITPNTNQTRRIYAQPIKDKDTIIGVVAVAYYNPKNEILPSIDAQLASTLKQIASEITVHEGIINVQQIDERKIPYNISFTVVDKYNTILKSATNVNGIKRIPNFIDPSYVKMQLTAKRERIIQDSQTGEYFLTETEIINDKHTEPVGFIIMGQSLTPVVIVLQQYIVLQGLWGIGLLLCYYFIANHILSARQQDKKISRHPPHFSFNEEKGILLVDNHEIPIPYATNQFYLLQALFRKPAKRWETDELLKKFGEEESARGGRKVYDAMVKINNKVAAFTQVKLIINQNKTYQLNLSVFSTS